MEMNLFLSSSPSDFGTQKVFLGKMLLYIDSYISFILFIWVFLVRKEKVLTTFPPSNDIATERCNICKRKSQLIYHITMAQFITIFIISQLQRFSKIYFMKPAYLEYGSTLLQPKINNYICMDKNLCDKTNFNYYLQFILMINSF